MALEACCLLLEAWRLLLEAWALFFIFAWRFKIICNVVLGYFSPEPLHRAALQPVMKLVVHWRCFHNHSFLILERSNSSQHGTVYVVRPLIAWPQVQQDVFGAMQTRPGLKVDPRLVGLIIHIDPKGLQKLRGVGACFISRLAGDQPSNAHTLF